MAEIAKKKFTVPSPFVNLVHLGVCLELINTTEVFKGLHRFFDYFPPSTTDSPYSKKFHGLADFTPRKSFQGINKHFHFFLK